MHVLIVGASGNLGSRFAASFLDAGHSVRLSFNRTQLQAGLVRRERAEPWPLDLDDPIGVTRAVEDIDAVVYCAGKLFAPNPASFLPRTNYEWARRAIDAAVAAGVRKFVLLSFPHVEEGTTPECPAMGSLDAEPRAIHARTRLQAERHLLAACSGSNTTPVILRLGMVYGAGMRLIEAARALMRWRLMAVWREPTWVHLIHIEDAVRAVRQAVEVDDCVGVYNVCDERPLTMQELLDALAGTFGYARPLRLPNWCFWTAAWCCQACARVFRSPCPINPDIVRMGMTSVVADTSRFRGELLAELSYPTLNDGLRELRSR